MLPIAKTVSLSNEAMYPSYTHNGKRKRTVISCTECHRRKQKCDRRQPCAQCVSRGKQLLCLYEDPDSKEGRSTSRRVSEGDQIMPALPNDLSGSSMPDSLGRLGFHELTEQLGYSAHHNSNTLGILRNCVPPAMSESSGDATPSSLNGKGWDKLSQEYRELVRLLPSKRCIDKLITTFFSAVSWQYDVIDELQFRALLTEWGKISYTDLQQGPHSMSADMRYFPALLFQVLAHALMYQPLNGKGELEELKYAPGMTFLNLAEEFSEAGSSILDLLRKQNFTMVVIQAGFFRVWFLKTIGRVVEAWHTLSATIRDAEEIGMQSAYSPKVQQQYNQIPDAEVEWENEMRRRIWLMLCLWDWHMAVILGRPRLTNSPSDDSNLPRDFQTRTQSMKPVERTEIQVPTSFTLILVGYHTAYQYLPRIYDLGSTSNLNDYAVVDSLNSTILANVENMPEWCHPTDPDRRFDSDASCPWLPLAREALLTEVHHCLLALHRPYIFSVQRSRHAALKAASAILRSQSRLFPQTEPEQYMSFGMVFPSFDALVLTASIHILYYSECQDYLEASNQYIAWGLDRLHILGQYNEMARRASRVVLGLYNRLSSCSGKHRSEPVPSAGGISPATEIGESAKGRPELFAGDIVKATSKNAPAQSTVSNGSLSHPHIYSLEPPQPIHDLFSQYFSNNGIFEVEDSSSLLLDSSVRSIATGHEANITLPDENFWAFMSSL